MTLATSPKTGMTRTEAYECARALQDAGWTYRQIATEMCLSVSSVRDLFYDPDGSKARARKRRNLMRSCNECGEPTWGEHCETCEKARIARDVRYWTPEGLLDAAREWRRVCGDWPTIREWRSAQTIDGYRFPAFSQCYCSPGAARRWSRAPWGTWREYLEAAGAEPGTIYAGRNSVRRKRRAA